MHYEGLIHSTTNDSKPMKLNFNLSQFSNYKLLVMSHTAYSKGMFLKGEFFCR